MSDVTEKWLAGETKRQNNQGETVSVPRKDFSAEDYAKGIAEVREAYRRNKSRSWVLQILEEHIADAYLQRTAK